MLDVLPIAIGDLVDPPLRIELIREEAVLMAELFGEEGIDERDVVVHAARFENLFASETEADVPLAFADVIVALVVVLAEFAFIPTILDVFPELEPQPVRIDLSGMRGNRAGVVIGKVDHFRII